MATASPTWLKANMRISLPDDRSNRWSIDTDQSTPSTVHEADLTNSNPYFSKDSDTLSSHSSTALSGPEMNALCDDDVKDMEPGSKNTLTFLESLQDKIADELRLLEWEMTTKDDVLSEILGYHYYYAKDDTADSESSTKSEESGDLSGSESTELAEPVWRENPMHSSVSSQASSWISDVGGKAMSESGVMADVETSGATSPTSVSSNDTGNHRNEAASRLVANGNDLSVGTLTFFASNKHESTKQLACLDWYVKLLVNSIIRSVSVIFDDTNTKVQWQNLYSDLHLYNTEQEPYSTDEAQYIEKPLRFYRRFTDSNIFFGNTYYEEDNSDIKYGAEGSFGYQMDGTWYTSTEDEWTDCYAPNYDGGIPPARPWQAPWRQKARHVKPRGSEPIVSFDSKFNGLVFENSNLNKNVEKEDERMFHKARYQMHDIHYQLRKLRNSIYETSE